MAEISMRRRFGLQLPIIQLRMERLENVAELASVQASVTHDDEDLVLRAKRRDPGAWSQIYDLHYLHLYRYAYGRLGDRDEAQDVTSQVFVEALEGIDRFRFQGKPLLAWLYSIARHLIADRFRRARRAEDRLSRLHWEAVTSTPAMDGRAERADLIEALSNLTSEQREVIILRFFVGLTAREAGQLLNKSEYAVFSLQVRAVNSLRRHLAVDGLLLEGRQAA
ncbi:MAG TPA: RNA polymerase sigma factor [Dehalococcoidia bacterium]